MHLKNVVPKMASKLLSMFVFLFYAPGAGGVCQQFRHQDHTWDVVRQSAGWNASEVTDSSWNLPQKAQRGVSIKLNRALALVSLSIVFLTGSSIFVFISNK